MAYWIGGIVGGVIAITILTYVVEKLFAQRAFNSAVKGKLVSVAIAYVIAGTIAGFGFANGGPYAWWAWGLYILPALLVGAWAYKRGSDIDAGLE